MVVVVVQRVRVTITMVRVVDRVRACVQQQVMVKEFRTVFLRFGSQTCDRIVPERFGVLGLRRLRRGRRRGARGVAHRRDVRITLRHVIRGLRRHAGGGGGGGLRRGGARVARLGAHRRRLLVIAVRAVLFQMLGRF